MKQVTKLTPAQEARFPEFVRKWIDIGLSTAPADRTRAEAAIAGLYKLANLKEPRVIWLPCPISAALSAVAYAKAINRLAPRDVEVDLAVRSAVDTAVRSAVDTAVRSAVRSAVDTAVDSAVRSAVRSAVASAVGWAVDSAVRSAVASAAGSAADSAVASAVYLAVDSAVHSAVDSAVRSAVASAAGSAANSAVASAVYLAVDSAVHSAAGSAVHSAVASAVESAVDSAGRSYFGGSIWSSGYSAWADYFNEVCSIAIDRNFLEMTQTCGFYWTLDGVCFASERPSEINLDAEGRLHSETGMSIKYAGTGWGLFHWHGTQVPGEWIFNRASLTPSVALKQQNVEQRRAACEILGWANILRELKAKTIDHDNDPEIGDLVEVKLPDLREKAKFLRVRCGTGREFAIGIPPHINKALDAQAWIIGLEPSQFQPPEVRA